MILLLILWSVFNSIAISIVAGRVIKMNGHHHGGFTAGSSLRFKE